MQAKIIPEAILQTCIKISNEPPSDMKSNMRRALAAFPSEIEERLSTPAKRSAFKSIMFGLCFYHSLLLGRKKFGTGIGIGALMKAATASRMLRKHSPGTLSANLPLCNVHDRLHPCKTTMCR